ncbi:VOC family protein [Luteimicrobium sp. NPDC057192]|uniref:VOC family protein n=1 Tax=Luteimicrobium sp. NPDC057192 TaxID=3346042 RepID=UPI0036387437
MDQPVRWGVTVDCADPRVVARFWALALGYREPPPPEGQPTWDAWFDAHGVPPDERDDATYLADPSGRLPTLSFLKVPEPKTTKNRLHLDVKVSGGRDVPQERREAAIRAKVAELVAAGGRTLQEYTGPRGLDHVVLADPEGNELCVV